MEHSSPLPMRFAPLAVVALLALSACREAPDAPNATGTENPDATVPVEMQAGVGGTLEGLAPGPQGITPPETALDLGEGTICFVYAAHVARVSPVGSEGEPRGDEVAVVSREAGDEAGELCARPLARLITSDSTLADTFAGIEGDVLFLDRASDEDGQTLVAIDLAADDTEVFAMPYETDTMEIADGVLTFGTLEDRTRSTGDLAGIDCEQGAQYIDDGLDVGIIRIVTFDLSTREVTETDERTCAPLG